MYQALVDNVMEQLEESHDRSRSFSHVPSDEEGQMVEPNHESWERFQERIAEICSERNFVLKADISNYFERLPGGRHFHGRCFGTLRHRMGPRGLGAPRRARG